ncbi:hypothetical protein [Pseudanabaena yagii]|uniref:Uncharacterized protein n=1 Tax=Pseudanabaena yagii GIHE-NHR1 TaxID=2722753 RepID=A0ABX1M2B9_9CYAN|nr:hypothetical protein [Pseudanabaena yagii]NMF61154.1 hypothetical protein [Pseudanabaena yagii GIHE-NHR1]
MNLPTNLDSNNSFKPIQYVAVAESCHERNLVDSIEQEFNIKIDLIVVKERAIQIVNSAIKLWWDEYQLTSIPDISEESNLDLITKSKKGLHTNEDIFINEETSKAQEFIKTWISDNNILSDSARDIKIKKEAIRRFAQESRKLIKKHVMDQRCEIFINKLNEVRSTMLKNMSKQDKNKWGKHK